MQHQQTLESSRLAMLHMFTTLLYSQSHQHLQNVSSSPQRHRHGRRGARAGGRVAGERARAELRRGARAGAHTEHHRRAARGEQRGHLAGGPQPRHGRAGHPGAPVHARRDGGGRGQRQGSFQVHWRFWFLVPR